MPLAVVGRGTAPHEIGEPVMRKMAKLAVIGVAATTLGLGLGMPAAFADPPPLAPNPHSNSQGNCNGVDSSTGTHNGQTVKQQAQDPYSQPGRGDLATAQGAQDPGSCAGH